MAHWDDVTPNDIKSDFEAMVAEIWSRPYSLTAATYSGPAGQLRLVGFDIPPSIPDERFVTVTID